MSVALAGCAPKTGHNDLSSLEIREFTIKEFVKKYNLHADLFNEVILVELVKDAPKYMGEYYKKNPGREKEFNQLFGFFASSAIKNRKSEENLSLILASLPGHLSDEDVVPFVGKTNDSVFNELINGKISQAERAQLLVTPAGKSFTKFTVLYFMLGRKISETYAKPTLDLMESNLQKQSIN